VAEEAPKESKKDQPKITDTKPDPSVRLVLQKSLKKKEED